MLQPGYALGFVTRSSVWLEDQVTAAGVFELVESADLFSWLGGVGDTCDCQSIGARWSPLEASERAEHSIGQITATEG